MKKTLTVMLFLVLLATHLPAQASLHNGNWTNPGGAPYGIWTEYFWGGGPGQPGNEIQATKWGIQYGAAMWHVQQAYLLSSEQIAQNVYRTTYSGGTLFLSSEGPWWTVDPGYYDWLQIGMTRFTNTTTFYENGAMAFTITGYGIYNDPDPNVPDQQIRITATYGPGTPRVETNYLNSPSGHYDLYTYLTDELTGTTVSINPVPIPGALWLLGSGLLGLIGLRRRMEK